MTGIYNTTHSRGRRPLPNSQSSPAQQQMMQRRLLAQRRAGQNAAQQPEEIPDFQEFPLMSCKKRGKSHLMEFKTPRDVQFSNFARPVKLQRKENIYQPYNRQSPSGVKGEEIVPNGEGSSSSSQQQQQQQQQQQHGPKTGADTSLIAPMGGATRNKQMLFKKRTKQIFLAKEDTRELREQEQKPWILEDYDGQNSFTGTFEGGQRSNYVFLVLSDDGNFKVVPVDRWYKFQAKRNYPTLTLEEAEEQIKNNQKRDQDRWMMMSRNREQMQEAGASTDNKKKHKLVDRNEPKPASDDEGEGGGPRHKRSDSDIDDIDFEEVFEDDEEGGGEHEIEDEDQKDGKERIKRETKGYQPGAENDDDEDEDPFNEENLSKLTSEGKQMRKLVRDLEENRAYESDEEGDPYASSADEAVSEEEVKEEEKKEKEPEQKKAAVLPKRKGPVPGSKHMQKKPLLKKKEGLSRPIGRPGSPSLYMKKEDSATSASPPLRASSASPPRDPNAIYKKRKHDESHDGKHAKQQRLGGASSSGSPGGHDEGLITEQEVIATLRGRKMTTKEFLMHFRKRIKKNENNRKIITTLLKKVARHHTSDDPNQRILELRPELQ